MLLLIFVLSEVLLDYRMLQPDANSDEEKDNINFLQVPGLPNPNLYRTRKTWSSWDKSSRGVQKW